MDKSDDRNSAHQKPVILLILDGWGENPVSENNAIKLARTPTWNKLVKTFPKSVLKTSGEDVGLPIGQFGNSEVGHLNIGAGRVVYQDLPKIELAITNRQIDDDPVLREFAENVKSAGGTCHLLGLLSPGGVHSHTNHILALARILSSQGLSVSVHAFLDGRDTPPQSAAEYLNEFVAQIEAYPNTRLATLCGRYFAMDRDRRWERTEKAYAMLVDGAGEKFQSPLEAINASYKSGISDEFVEPCIIPPYQGMSDGDGLLMANFRADRTRQILAALLDHDFDGFDRRHVVSFSSTLGMVSYSRQLDRMMPSLFPPILLEHVIGEVIAKAGLKQLRLAETEKYAHVTYFLNGGLEDVFEGEERFLIPSPKVATYDLKPEMSANEITDYLVKSIHDKTFDFIVVNYANGDMVGHTGSLPAAIQAAETLDGCLKRVVDAVVAEGGVMLVTADHGNFEMMVDPDTGKPHTAHTLNVVPAVLVGYHNKRIGLRDGRLADIAPTLLQLLNIDKPAEMTGTTLLQQRQDD